MKKDLDGIWLFESFFVMTRCPMFLKKIIFFEQYRGYNLLYSEAGAVGAGHDI